MDKAASLKLPDEAKEQHIFDADFHLQVPVDELIPYIDDETIRSVVKEDGIPTWKSQRIHGGYSKESDYNTSETFESHFGSAYTSEDIHDVKEEMGINAVFVTPTPSTVAGGRDIYPEVSTALTQAYNDFVLDNVIDLDKEIYAGLYLPNWNIDASLRELDRHGSEPGFIGVSNWPNNTRLWGECQYNPIFEKLVSLNLPLCLHIMTFNYGPPLVRLSMRTHTEQLMATHPYTVIANLMNMIMGGVFDDYPTLNVLFQEAGSLWIPYVAWRADDMYQSYAGDIKLVERKHEKGDIYLDKMPSEYIFENVYVTTQPMSLTQTTSRSHVKKLLDVCSAKDMFLYSSDWPHPTTDPVNWLFDLPLEDDVRDRIASENANEVLRIPQ